NTPKPIRAEPRRAREAGSGVAMSVDCVNNVSEQATAFVAGPAGCEHDSDNVATAVGPVMRGSGPGLVSPVTVPFQDNANRPATVAVWGVMPGAINVSTVKVNVKVPPPLRVVGTETTT